MIPLSPRSKTQNKILNYFFLHEKEPVYINALARMIEDDPKNVYRVLCRLEDQGILTSEFRGQQRYFGLNRSNPLTRHYREIFLKTAGIEHMLQQHLKGVKGLKTASIFGSYARGKVDRHSDIDLLIIAEASAVEVQKALSPVEKSTGRDINPVIFSPKEYQKKKGSDPLLKNIEKNKKVRLI